MDYFFVSDREWTINSFLKNRNRLTGNWSVITTPSDLKVALLTQSPRYIFFPHWSAIVPNEIVQKHTCICFHMTNLPFGRGGSPLQNLISKGFDETVLTSLRMTEVIDGGPIYKKDNLYLDGSARDVFDRMSNLAIEQIIYIIENNPRPTPQVKTDYETFQRLKPSDSEILSSYDLDTLYNHIRMLDAPGYPRAFIKKEKLRFTFTNVKKDVQNDRLFASVEIKVS